MCAMSNQYRMRLKNEYDKIRLLPRNDLYTVEPEPGEPAPFVRRYRVTYNVPTWVEDGGQLKKQTRTVVKITLNGLRSAPTAVVAEGKIPYHPNWFPSGTVCNGHAWSVEMWLYEYINFICEILQFKPLRIDPTSPANIRANEFWKQHRNDRKLFPTDTRTLPVPREPLKISVVKVTGNK